MNPKDPQAELLKDLKQLITGSEFQDYLYSRPDECVDAILALFQAHQQQQVEQLRWSRSIMSDMVNRDRVTDEWIERKIGGLNG